MHVIGAGRTGNWSPSRLQWRAWISSSPMPIVTNSVFGGGSASGRMTLAPRSSLKNSCVACRKCRTRQWVVCDRPIHIVQFGGGTCCPLKQIFSDAGVTMCGNCTYSPTITFIAIQVARVVCVCLDRIAGCAAIRGIRIGFTCPSSELIHSLLHRRQTIFGASVLTSPCRFHDLIVSRFLSVERCANTRPCWSVRGRYLCIHFENTCSSLSRWVEPQKMHSLSALGGFGDTMVLRRYGSKSLARSIRAATASTSLGLR